MASPIRTATGSSLAVTLNTEKGVITTESLTTAAGAVIAYVVTNSEVTASSIVLAQISGGDAVDATEDAVVTSVVPAAGSFTVNIQNVGSAALDDVLVFSFVVFN